MSMTKERIIRTDYSEIMQKNYIDYAMSVIIARALPDVRDGLKPVQRRVLYDMWELGTRYDRPYRKSARIVGDTMGKYHPHGDSSIYESLVVMAQDFKKGQILVDGHGNFGSIEGDGAAAMRYTEARLMKFTQELFLSDLDRDVVDFIPNFDENEQEPVVLPAKIPNILVNGSEGIAVGMATSIPPHNLTEVIDAVQAFIRDDRITDDELMTYIMGPDFPTGGIVTNADDLKSIYRTGSGKIRIRGKVEIEKSKGGKTNIVVTELPYTMIGNGIGKFLNDVAELAENRTCPDITDISNQSSKEGIRIVIELRKGADPEETCNLLYKKTKLEDTFGVNMLVVSNGRPETMSLRQIIEACVDFRFEIADRKYQNLLARELEQREIQEGLIRACDVIDLIIEILRGSKNRKMAMDCLVMGKTEGIRFRSEESRRAAAELIFTERQADAILDMRLVKLIGLEIEALTKAHAETLKKIEYYRNLLEDHDAMSGLLISEFEEMKKEYGKARRTAIENAEEIVIVEKKQEAEEVIFSLDRFGYAKLLDPAVYEKNKVAVDAESRWIFRIMNDEKIAVFTDVGKLHTLKISDVPLKKVRDKGVPIDNLSNYSSREEMILFLSPYSFVLTSELTFVTRKGLIKRTMGSEFLSSVRTIQSTKLGEGDRLICICPSDGADQAVIQTHLGCFLKFALSEVPELKKSAVGVKAVSLEEEDFVEEAYLIESGREYQIEYRGAKLILNRLKLAKRAGKGVRRK